MKNLKRLGMLLLVIVMTAGAFVTYETKAQGAKSTINKITLQVGRTDVIYVKGNAKAKSSNKKIVKVRKVSTNKNDVSAIELKGKKAGKAVVTIVLNQYQKKITVKVTPLKVQGVKVVLKNMSAVKLSWKKANGAVKYEVWRSVNKKDGYKKIGTVKKTSFTDKKTNGEYYYYKIRGIGNKKMKGKCSSPIAIKAYKLVWGDEFNGKALDLLKWTEEDEQEYSSALYKKGHCQLKDGKLILKPTIRWDTSKNHCVSNSVESVKISTKNKKTFTHGKIEVVAKLPRGEGISSYGWLLGKGTWPDSGEIDIFENNCIAGLENKIVQAIHNKKFNGFSGQAMIQEKEIEVEKIAGKYHTYGIEWNETNILFFIDGKQTYSYDLAKFGDASSLKKNQDYWPFDNPFNFILQCDITEGVTPKNWTKIGSEGTIETYEDYMVIDSVRVYR